MNIFSGFFQWRTYLKYFPVVFLGHLRTLAYSRAQENADVQEKSLDKFFKYVQEILLEKVLNA